MGIQAKKAILNPKLRLQTAKELEDYRHSTATRVKPPTSNGQASTVLWAV